MSAPTQADIDAAMTPEGGWTRETLAAWGVSWPPPKGWKRRLLAKAGSLNPCPFCSETFSAWSNVVVTGHNREAVQCPHCGARGPTAEIGGGIAAWNEGGAA